MSKTLGKNTPGGRPALQENPPSSEDDPKDSGEGQSLQNKIQHANAIGSDNFMSGNTSDNPFRMGKLIMRSPIRPRSISVENIARTKDLQQMSNSSSQLISGSDLNDKIIQSLQAELKEARNEIQKLKLMLEQSQPRKNDYTIPNSSEEEEIVAYETAYLLPKTKKRKRSSGKGMQAGTTPDKTENYPNPKAKTQPENNIMPGKHTTFQKTQEPKKSKQNPPPVILSNVTNYSVINKSLQDNSINFQAKLMNNQQLKINVVTETDYRNLTEYLNGSQQQWHSYENKHTRPIRVMVRNLHQSCNPEDIKRELSESGFKIIDVVNKIKKSKKGDEETRIPLPLFMLTFDNKEDIRKIYEIKHLCHMGVKIEAVRSNRIIPQCKRCQRYGHTQKFCQHEPRCVKCAEKHLTIACEKPRSTAAKCSNCAQAHPASYRGCLVAKELQKRRNNQNKPTSLQKSQPTESFSHHVRSGISYAQVAETGKVSSGQVLNPTHSNTMMEMMQNVMNAISNLSKRLQSLEQGSSAILY